MKSSVFRRHFLVTAVVLLISFLLLAVSFITFSYQYTVRDKKQTLTANSEYISYLVSIALDQGLLPNDNSMSYLVSFSSQLSDSTVILTNTEGNILFVAGNSAELNEVDFSGASLPESLVEEVLANGAYTGMTTLGLLPSSCFVSCTPITLSDGQVAGLAVVANSIKNLTEMWRSFASIFFFVAVVVLCIAFISCSITTLQLTRPLKDMADRVRRFGMGEYDLRFDDDRTDELGELTQSFNAMADAIAQSEQKRREFVANISHELKTPMTTISGFSDGILDGTIPPEKQEEALRLISSETRRLSRLVRQMLDLSQLQAKEAVSSQVEFDAAEVLLQVLISLENKITSRGLDMDVRVPDSAVMVWGDPDGITQVYYNLLDNAAKFATPGSTITLTLETHGNKAVCSVRNLGETIAPQELNLLFDRFHKTDRSRSEDKDGVGLGLYIVKTILNQHKENITVTSQDGVTEFTFTLTLA